jgi:hypothetical protein
MFFIEINEFNVDLMAKAAETLNANNLRRLLNLKHTETTTDDKFERFGLDPWVQWVSIHTGKTSAQHGISHLGDVPQLNHPQIWETLSINGFHSGVWGAMNASKGAALNCDFFFPDPWSFSERAFPSELNNLLAFPRYYSKNYGDLDRLKAAQELFKLILFCANPRIMKVLLPIGPKIIGHIIKNGIPEYLLFVLFDLVNAKLFASYYKKTKPDFALLFLNSLAHLQHHKWTIADGLSEEMRIAFLLFDEVMGQIFNIIPPEHPIVIANAFTQYCSYDQNEFLYRQKNPERFLQTVGIIYNRVEQAMTNDGHVFFETFEAAQKAAEILSTATVNAKKVFFVEHDRRSPGKLFFQMILWDQLEESSLLFINGKTILFFDLFDRVTRRSGSHLQRGDVFSRGINFPHKIHNHEIHDYIISAFK